MTDAPLPPLPNTFENHIQGPVDIRIWSPAQVKAYAALAVREALERLRDELEPGTCICSIQVEHMLKEYK